MKQASFSFRELAPCFFAIFIDILGFGIVYPVLISLFTSHDTSILANDASQNLRFFYLSLGFLLYPLFMFFGSSFMGDLSDILGRKKVLLICMGGYFIGSILMGIGIKTASISFFLIGRGSTGLMGASMPIALATITDLSTPKNKAVHMSFVVLAQSFGFVLGPMIGGVLSDATLAHYFDLSIPFFFTALLAVIAFFWLKITFKETFVRKLGKKINFNRFFKVFVEASRDKAIRQLSLVLLFMQMGFALYLQLILIDYKNRFDYSNWEMGTFNAFLGFWFALTIAVVVPWLVKKISVEKIALFSLLITAIFELLIALTTHETLLWIFAVPFAIAFQLSLTSILTSFSNAANKNSQGWAMGITGSIMALSFIFMGLSPNLVPFTGVKPLIFLGGLFTVFSTIFMAIYCKRILPTISTKG